MRPKSTWRPVGTLVSSFQPSRSSSPHPTDRFTDEPSTAGPPSPMPPPLEDMQSGGRSPPSRHLDPEASYHSLHTTQLGAPDDRSADGAPSSTAVPARRQKPTSTGYPYRNGYHSEEEALLGPPFFDESARLRYSARWRHRTRSRRQPQHLWLINKVEYLLASSTLLCFFFWMLYVAKYDNAQNASNRHPFPPPPGSTPTHDLPARSYYDTTCETASCWHASRQILNALNSSVSPCDDFYSYACGGWEEAHPIPDDKTRIGYFALLQDQNLATIRSLLEQPKAERQSTVFDQMQTIYGACLDRTQLNARGVAPVETFIRGFPELDEGSALHYLTNMTAYLTRGGVSTFLSLDVAADARQPDRYTAYLGPDGLTMTRPDYNNTATVTILKTAMTQIFGHLSETSTQASAHADAVLSFETQLARITPDPVDLQDPIATYNAYNLSTLQTTFDHIVDYGDVLTKLGASHVAGTQTIIVVSPEYLAQLKALLTDTFQQTLRSYFIWRTIVAYKDELSDDIATAFRPLEERLSGSLRQRPRWEHCVQLLDDVMGMAVGRSFVEAIGFDSHAKEQVTNMLDAIKNEFVQNLYTLEWLDDATRAAARSKAEKIKTKIGFPSWILDESRLLERYTGLHAKKTHHFENLQMSASLETTRRWARFDQPNDGLEWLITPATVNAYYEPTANEICVPAGILQAPFWVNGAPDYINLGAIGVVLGHELSHAFDSNGRQYDEDGQLRDWWSSEASENFQKLTECFVHLFDDFKVPTGDQEASNVSGRLTLGENLADAGGMTTTRRVLHPPTNDRFHLKGAPQPFASGSHKSVALPNLHTFSPDQLYYLSFAQIWCSTIRPEKQKTALFTDPHAPASCRVVGTVMSNNDFAHAFGCQRHDAMNPAQKCKVW